MSEVSAKHCAKCNEQKPAGEFHRSKTGSGGLHGYCKPCQHQFYVDRKIRLVSEGLCLSCALGQAEPGMTRCITCRLRQKADETRRRTNKKGVSHDPIRPGHPVGIGIGASCH